MFAARPQRVLENVPADLPALDQPEQAPGAEVHAAEHARIDGLEAGLRQALEAALDAAGRRERVSDAVGAEVAAHHRQPGPVLFGQPAGVVRIRRRVLIRTTRSLCGGEAGCRPLHRPDRRHGPPEVVGVLRIEHRDVCIGVGHVDQRKQARVLPKIQAALRDDDARDGIDVRAAARPEPRDFALIRRAVALGLRVDVADAFDLVVVARIEPALQIEQQRRLGAELRTALHHERRDFRPARELRRHGRGRIRRARRSHGSHLDRRRAPAAACTANAASRSRPHCATPRWHWRPTRLPSTPSAHPAFGQPERSRYQVL